MARQKQNETVQSITADIDVYRDQVCNLIEKLDAVAAAPPPESEIRTNIVLVVQQAERFARESWNPAALLSARPEANLENAYRADALGTSAIIHGAEFMVDALVREVLAQVATSGAKPMSADARIAEVERIEGAIFEAEVREEKLIRCALNEFGAEIPRRSDIRNTAVFLATDAALEKALA